MKFSTTRQHYQFVRKLPIKSKQYEYRKTTVLIMRWTVVVDSHIQRNVLATEETTVTQQVSHRPIKCQIGSRSWLQIGTKVNGLHHHGDNLLLRPIATRRVAALQAMAPTNVKTVHQTSLLHNIESNLDRLGMLSPTHDKRSQQQSGQITLQTVLITSLGFSRPHIVQK